MQLSRLTPCTLFEIEAPIWGGGKRVVGLNEKRISKHNEIHFMYRRKKDGRQTFPDPYYFDGDKLKHIDYQRQRFGFTTVVLVPFDDLERLYRV